jgi:hypothetical protein
VTATLIGAGIGAVVGYLFFTERGRELRRQIEPALEDLSRELYSFRSTVQKATGVANEGWKLLIETMGESGPQPPPRYPTAHQSSPF